VCVCPVQAVDPFRRRRTTATPLWNVARPGGEGGGGGKPSGAKAKATSSSGKSNGLLDANGGPRAKGKVRAGRGFRGGGGGVRTFGPGGSYRKGCHAHWVPGKPCLWIHRRSWIRGEALFRKLTGVGIALCVAAVEWRDRPLPRRAPQVSPRSPCTGYYKEGGRSKRRGVAASGLVLTS
jgi:hypothetical protein